MTSITGREAPAVSTESESPVALDALETDQERIRVGHVESVLATLVLLLWIAVFLAGILINSQPYREAMADLSQMSFGLALSTMGVIFISYTISNVAFLSILAGILGTAARRSQFGTDDEKVEGRDTIAPYLSAILRGFMVYLIVISGTLLVIDQPFEAARVTQAQYVRLAGVLSVMSFSVNLDPRQVSVLMAWAKGIMRRTDDAQPKTPKPEPAKRDDADA